jgi:hypothetical protein
MKNFRNVVEYVPLSCGYSRQHLCCFFKEEKTIADKKTIIDYLVKEGVTTDEISDIMQTRCKAKKVLGSTTGSFIRLTCDHVEFQCLVDSMSTGKKSDDKQHEKSLNETTNGHDESSNLSSMSNDVRDRSQSIKDEITPKRNAQRSVKGKVTKYVTDHDNDDDDGDDGDDDDNVIHGMQIDEQESDYMGSDSDTERKLKKVTAKPKKIAKPKSGTILVERENKR